MSSNDRRTLERPAKKEAPRQSFLTGAFGGFSLVAVSHPFDLIKVRMQAASSTASPLATLRQAIGGPAGLLGLYRGVSPVLMGTPVCRLKDY